MKINFNNERLVSKNCQFEGETEDGRSFLVFANWNEGDDNWAVDSVYWLEEEGSEEENEEIIEMFLSEINE
jgi:hypothetical protein